VEDPDVVPRLPSFTPKRTPGVQPPLNVGFPSPADIFSFLFDLEIIKILCANTNKNAARNKLKGKTFIWKEFTPLEMGQYLCVLLYMTVCHFPKITDFWRTKHIFSVPFPATVLPCDRFLAISKNLHMSDPSDDAANDQKKGTEDYDCLHWVKPILDMIRDRCMSIYHPKKHISVDERMVATKATKWGLRLFGLTDVNGYTIDYKLYTGKSKFASGKGLAYDVVASLVNKDYLGSGYIIYCDRFYTSPLLFRHLGQQGFGACGTYRQGRVGFPTTQENALHKKSPKGTIRWIRDRDLLYVKWMDTREVSICTNVHPVYNGETVLRWQKTDEGHQKLPVPRPTAVGEYNTYMGGVDTSDQMLATNSVHQETTRWHMTVFLHLVDIAATNSFIIHKEISDSQQQRPMTRQAFQEKLCAQLLGVPLDGVTKPTGQKHLPVEQSSTASAGRRKCVLCRRCTPWQCWECNVSLCLQIDRNCFEEYHQ